MKRKAELIQEARSLGVSLYVDINNTQRGGRLKTKGELEWDIQLAKASAAIAEFNALTFNNLTRRYCNETSGHMERDFSQFNSNREDQYTKQQRSIL